MADLSEMRSRLMGQRDERRHAFAQMIGGWDEVCRHCHGDACRKVDEVYQSCPDCHGTGARCVTWTDTGQAIPFAFLGRV